jgi:hypothetical protein
VLPVGLPDEFFLLKLATGVVVPVLRMLFQRAILVEGTTTGQAAGVINTE